MNNLLSCSHRYIFLKHILQAEWYITTIRLIIYTISKSLQNWTFTFLKRNMAIYVMIEKNYVLQKRELYILIM